MFGRKTQDITRCSKMRRFIIFRVSFKKKKGGLNERDGSRGPCGTHEIDEKCMLNFVMLTWEQETAWKT